MGHITISGKNWTDELAKAIQKAKSGDTIKCQSNAMKELGLRAQARMCPEKKLYFEIDIKEQS